MQSKDQKDLELKTVKRISPGEIIIGTLVNIDAQGQPLVDYPDNPEHTPLLAVSTLGVNKQYTGRQVALLFANGDIKKPVIMGLIHNPLHDIIENYEKAQAHHDDIELWPTELKYSKAKQKLPEHETTIDGKRIVLEAHDEIVLKCGEASITLTKAGKIIIRGKYIVSRSSGVNRIMGGSVQVN